MAYFKNSKGCQKKKNWLVTTIPQLPTLGLRVMFNGTLVVADSRANNSAATHDIGASRSGWKIQEQLGGCFVE